MRNSCVKLRAKLQRVNVQINEAEESQDSLELVRGLCVILQPGWPVSVASEWEHHRQPAQHLISSYVQSRAELLGRKTQTDSLNCVDKIVRWVNVNIFAKICMLP